MKVYLIGSLRNPAVPEFANELRSHDIEVFDDWFAPGPEADDFWQKYEQSKGKSLEEALQGYAARHIFEFDFRHLNEADVGILFLPAGKSGHLELGYLEGLKKKTYILFHEKPERWDVMYCFATKVFFDKKQLIDELNSLKLEFD